MEVLAIVGAVASIAQLVQFIQSTSTRIVHFIDGLQNVSEDVRMMKFLLQTMNTKLEILSTTLVEPSNKPWLSPGICDSLKVCLLQVRKDVEAVSTRIKGIDAELQKSSRLRLRKRLRYQICDQKPVAKCLQWLKSSEENLQRIESIIHLCTTIEIYNRTQSALKNRSRLKPPMQRSRSSLISADTFWGLHGFLGSIVNEVHAEENEARTTFRVGVCLPSWLARSEVSLTVSFLNRSNEEPKMHWDIGIQFRVAHTSPLMMACERGDVPSIRQILDEGLGAVNNRTAYQGLTPLLIAIRGEHLEAVEYLLQKEADPDLPDDDQVTPLFAAVGMNPTAHPVFEQLPPTWGRWLDTVRLLVKYGASVSEVIRGRNLAGLNVERSGHPSRTLEFLQFLAAEDSVQLNVASGHPAWSALSNALRCNTEAVDALRLLSSAGVALNGISSDGRTVLHIAARVCDDASALDFLCENGCGHYINQPDRFGWTPFHYAVIARGSAICNSPFAKVVTLLRRGADPSIRVTENALEIYDQPPGSSTALELLKHARPERYDSLTGVLRRAGIIVPVECFANCA